MKYRHETSKPPVPSPFAEGDWVEMIEFLRSSGDDCESSMNEGGGRMGRGRGTAAGEPGSEGVQCVICAGTLSANGNEKEPRSFVGSDDSFAGRKVSEVALYRVEEFSRNVTSSDTGCLPEACACRQRDQSSVGSLSNQREDSFRTFMTSVRTMPFSLILT